MTKSKAIVNCINCGMLPLGILFRWIYKGVVLINILSFLIEVIITLSILSFLKSSFHPTIYTATLHKIPLLLKLFEGIHYLYFDRTCIYCLYWVCYESINANMPSSASSKNILYTRNWALLFFSVRWSE